MVGNYLTTLNRPVEMDLQMIRDLGLDPCWEDEASTPVVEGAPAACGCGSPAGIFAG
jgi:biotin synthase-like enzyme